MSSTELYFTVLGSSGAGKITLLACMNKFFREMFAGVYHAGDSGSLDFDIAATNTENFREYSFTLNNRLVLQSGAAFMLLF